jgi:hypothetical protein
MHHSVQVKYKRSATDSCSTRNKLHKEGQDLILCIKDCKQQKIMTRTQCEQKLRKKNSVAKFLSPSDHVAAGTVTQLMPEAVSNKLVFTQTYATGLLKVYCQDHLQ